MNVHSQLIDIIYNILTNRKQSVRINKFLSYWLLIPSGVPHRSPISPLLFNIFMNDLFDLNLQSLIISFASDLKLYESPGEMLQNDLNKIIDWSQKARDDHKWKKCIVIHFGRNNSHFQYFINSSLLQTSERVRDLGIIVDARLKFAEQLKFIRSKCFKIINLIFKNICVRDFHFYCK